MQNHEKKKKKKEKTKKKRKNEEKKKKEVKNQDSMCKTNFFHSTLSFSPWAILSTWLHVGIPQKI
jgi:hypothetical protein